MQRNNKHADDCPLSGVHQRLQDSHRLWHLARDFYQDPDEFRIGLQNCISSLRSVSFILQNHKSTIPDFEIWYSKWQSHMRSDPIMVWAREARNKIEKRGDLATESKIQISVIASYISSEIPTIMVQADVESSLKEIFSKIPRVILNEQILQNGALKIERKWIDSELPDYEILDALAHVYGQLSLIIDDAHKQIGLSIPDFILVEHNGITEKYPASRADLQGKLPCMMAEEDHRVSYFSLKTMEPLDLRIKKPIRIPRTAQELKEIKKYKSFRNIVDAAKTYSSLDEITRAYFDLARDVFEKDGHHVPIAILLRDLRPLKVLDTHANTRNEKYIVMQELARVAKQYAADGVLIINEVWKAAYDSEKPFLYPQENPNRTEALTLIAANSKKEIIQYEAEILRRHWPLKPKLGQTIKRSEGTINLLAPLQKLWAQTN